MGTEADRPDLLAAVTRLLRTEGHRPLVDRVCAAVFGEHPGYEQLRDKAGFRSAVSALTHLYCATVAADRRLSADEAIALHVVGAQRARQGITEQELVAGVRTAVRTVWASFTAALAERCDSPAQLQSITAGLFDRTDAFVEEVLAAMCAGFRAEDEQRLPGRLRAQAAVVDRLVERGWSDEELFDSAREHGVPVHPPVAVLIATGPPGIDPSGLRGAVTEVAEQVPGLVDGPVRMPRAPHLVAVANEADEERMADLRLVAGDVGRRHGLAMTLSAAVDRPSLLAGAYEAAAADVALAPLARPRGGVVGPDELRLYRLLSLLPGDVRTDFALAVLGTLPQLPAAKRAELLDTFEAWLWADGNAERATGLLRGVSPQTVRYRLRTLRDVTGRNVRVATEALLLQLAVRIYRGWIEPLTADGL